MKVAIGVAPRMPALYRQITPFISSSYDYQLNLYPFLLHDLSFGLHAECLYFPD
jgi:hypothetical protein